MSRFLWRPTPRDVAIFSLSIFSFVQRIMGYVRPWRTVAVHPSKTGNRRSICGPHLEEPSNWVSARAALWRNWPSNAKIEILSQNQWFSIIFWIGRVDVRTQISVSREEWQVNGLNTWNHRSMWLVCFFSWFTTKAYCSLLGSGPTPSFPSLVQNDGFNWRLSPQPPTDQALINPGLS